MWRASWVGRGIRASTVAPFLVIWATAAVAQTDEIQVYDAEIADPGVFNLMVHNNFTPDGLKTPRFLGGLVPNETLNGVPEWAYGVTDWFEQGLYLPLYSLSSNDGPVLDGFKVRELFVVPHAAERTFFYGINFEFSYNAKDWDENRYTSEIRPIIGWHLGKFDFIINPIFDNSWKGFSQLDFAPSARIAFNMSKTWAVAVEQYSDFGIIKHFLPTDRPLPLDTCESTSPAIASTWHRHPLRRDVPFASFLAPQQFRQVGRLAAVQSSGKRSKDRIFARPSSSNRQGTAAGDVLRTYNRA
jgi:hypothetical protein